MSEQEFELGTIIAWWLILVLFIVGILSSSGCATCYEGNPTPDPTDSHLCPAACEHLRALGCEEGEDLDEDTTCEDWCVYTQGQEHWLNLPCISNVESCEDLETCEEPQ